MHSQCKMGHPSPTLSQNVIREVGCTRFMMRQLVKFLPSSYVMYHCNKFSKFIQNIQYCNNLFKSLRCNKMCKFPQRSELFAPKVNLFDEHFVQINWKLFKKKKNNFTFICELISKLVLVSRDKYLRYDNTKLLINSKVI